MKKPYALIRAQMVANGINQIDLARRLLLSRGCVSLKLCGVSTWTQDEMYAVMGILGLPYERMHELFPKRGVVAKSA